MKMMGMDLSRNRTPVAAAPSGISYVATELSEMLSESPTSHHRFKDQIQGALSWK